MTISKSALGIATYGVVQKWRPGPKPVTIPHAILNSSHVVIAIRHYPLVKASKSIIPIFENMECKIGWVWKHSKFQPPE